MIALLDVNVLVALFDPAHTHHETAHQWFEPNRESGWATCPLTENGLVRLISNPSYPGRRTTVQDATFDRGIPLEAIEGAKPDHLAFIGQPRPTGRRPPAF